MAQPPAGQKWSRRRFLVTVGGAAVTGLVAGTGLVELAARQATAATPAPTGTDAVAGATPSPTPGAVATAPAQIPTPSATAAVAYRTSGIRGVSVPLEARYFSRQPILPARPAWPVDRDGVPIIKRGTVVVQHPVDLASMGLQLVDSCAQTLNGFQFATFGLYDYDQAVHGADSAALLDGALTTVKHYLPAFRRPGDISHYCLAHHVVSAHYHDIVIRQLGKVAQMTGDPAFAAAAAHLRADHP